MEDHDLHLPSGMQMEEIRHRLIEEIEFYQKHSPLNPKCE